MSNFACLIKFLVGIFYVYVVFLVCYLPHFIFLATTEISGPSIIIKPSNLLLEDETHSIRYHGHTAEHVLAQKSRITLIGGPAMLCKDSSHLELSLLII